MRLLLHKVISSYLIKGKQTKKTSFWMSFLFVFIGRNDTPVKYNHSCRNINKSSASQGVVIDFNALSSNFKNPEYISSISPSSS